MEVPKDKILELLRNQGEHDKATEAERELPDQVDTERDAGLLQRFGLDPQQLIQLVGDIPGLKGKVPGF